MTPQQALELFRLWAMKVVVLEQAEAFNQAYRLLLDAVLAAERAKTAEAAMP